jgi:hypothetical protein
MRPHAALSIEYVDVSGLRPFPRNARTHTKKQIRQIANSIKQFGVTNPVLIDDDKAILAGHGRLDAAKLPDMRSIPCVRLSSMTPAQKRAYLLADNKLALNAGWDEEILFFDTAVPIQDPIDFIEVGSTDFRRVLCTPRSRNLISLGPLRRDRHSLARRCHTLKVSKFKIGQSVRLRSTARAGGAAGCEYRIVRQLTQADNIVRYRVRSSADERDEMVVKESQIHDWQNSKVSTHRFR